MEQVMEMAKRICDEAEVYASKYRNRIVTFKNARVHDIEYTSQAGTSLRIIKDGRLGFAYTKNLNDRRQLLQNALDSLAGGVAARFRFPKVKDLTPLDTYNDTVEKTPTRDIIDECARVCSLLKSKVDAEIRFFGVTHSSQIRILNSAGTDISMKQSRFKMCGSTVFPNSDTGVWRSFLSKEFGHMPEKTIQEWIDLFKSPCHDVIPKHRKMKVLFMPNSLVLFSQRLLRNLSAKNIFENRSPLSDKSGTKIFDKKLSLQNDPLDDALPGARAFDDEGMRCMPTAIIENGVLKNFCYDLDYASKMQTESNGHGFRNIDPEEDPIPLRPTPAFAHMKIMPGNKSLQELIAAIDQGLIVENVLAPSSGDLFGGGFSVGVNPGWFVENGQICGRVKNTIITGNIYETFSHIMDIGDTLDNPIWGVWGYLDAKQAPALLCDGVRVTTKK